MDLFGEFRQDEHWSDWWVSQKMNIPFLGGKQVMVALVNNSSSSIEGLMESFKKELKFLFSKAELINEQMLAELYEFCLENCFSKTMVRKLFCSADIWDDIDPYMICMVNDSTKINTIVNCECSLLRCNGLQLKFSQASVLPVLSKINNFIG